MLGGLVVPTPTLFDDRGGLDVGRNTRITRKLADAGVDHLFALGSLGEFPLVTDEERPRLVEAVVESLTRKADAWIGVGAASTSAAVRYAAEAEELGAAALVAVGPYYLHPTADGLRRYYRALKGAVRIPLLAYNIPSLVGYPLDPALVHGLAREGVLVGVKDTAGSMESVRGFLSGAPEGFSVLPGDDGLASSAILAGASGAVMGSANAVPKLGVELVAAAKRGDRVRAGELQALVDRFVAVIRTGPFPSVDKFLAQKLLGVEVGYREPYGPLSGEEERRVLDALQKLEPDLGPFR